jgi:hypothetical protein
MRDFLFGIILGTLNPKAWPFHGIYEIEIQ